MLVAQSRLTLCDPMDCGPPGSSVQRYSPGKNAIPDLPNPGMEPRSLALQADSELRGKPTWAPCLFAVCEEAVPTLCPVLARLAWEEQR